MSTPNRLYYGDCLTIMRQWPSQCVDLIYLDPPFNSNRQYNAIYKDSTGRPLPDQIDAFCDMWELDPERERVIRSMPVRMRESGVDDATAELWRLWMRALRNTQPRLLAYLSYMAERLLIMHRILKSTGTLYLHCDPTASHYIKTLLDAIFGHQNFRSEIIWQRTSAHNSARRWGPIHDTILMYTKSDHYRWHRVWQKYDESYLENHYRYKDKRGRYRVSDLTGPGVRNGASGQPWSGVNPTDSGRHWAVPPPPPWIDTPDGYAKWSVQERLDFLDEAGLVLWPERGSIPAFRRYLDPDRGVPIQDVIGDIPSVSGNEDTGYDTQKPRALLERIIKASSNPGDVVLDPFCGCATTIEAAHRLERQWIGIDIAIHAIKRVATVRLSETLGLVEGRHFKVEGVPLTVEGAQDLWRRDKYHFQKWAVEQVEGFVTTKRTADGGIDGRVYFAVPNEPDLQSMVLEVKGGKTVDISAWRALKGVMSREAVPMAGLIVMKPLSNTKRRSFDREVADLEPLTILGIEYPRMQILSIEEILNGKRFQTPTVAGRHTLEPRLPGIPA